MPIAPESRTIGSRAAKLALAQQVEHWAVPFRAREPQIQTLEFDRQTQVVYAEQIENGGVEIVDVHRVADDVVAEIVGLAVNKTAFDTSTGQPVREAAGMMITAVIVGS